MFLMLMRKLLCNLLFIFLLLVLSAYSSGSKDEKKNVEITLYLDKDMTEVEQNVYVWSFVSGNEQRIWDSVYVSPHSDSVTCVCQSGRSSENACGKQRPEYGV